MSDSNNQYIKFMSDIIESGLWGNLSPAAKTLYPVLLKFSDQNFKHVWPSTETLLKLTGFKTKKSITLGKKELIKEGLLSYRPGSGRTNSTYFFSFNYKGSKITPLWDTQIPPSVGKQSPSASAFHTSQGAPSLPPNHLNITINNTQSNKIDSKKTHTYDNLIDMYGFNLLETALQIAKRKGLENNIPYVSSVCKDLNLKLSNEKPNSSHFVDTAQHVIDSWRKFLDWSKSHLTRSSVDILEKLAIEVDGQSIFIKENLSDFLKQIILKFFNEEISPSILVVFSEISIKSYPHKNA